MINPLHSLLLTKGYKNEVWAHQKTASFLFKNLGIYPAKPKSKVKPLELPVKRNFWLLKVNKFIWKKVLFM